MESFAPDLRYHPRTPLQDTHIDALREIGVEKILEAGEYLAHSGDRMDVFYFIVAGRIDLVDPYTNNPYLDHGLGPGQFAGELTFLYRGTWTRDMRATERCSVIAVQRLAMLSLMARIPEISDIVIEVFSARRRRQLEAGDSSLTLIGADEDRAIREVAAFAARNRIPIKRLERGTPEALTATQVCGAPSDRPAVIFAPNHWVNPPSPRAVAALLGLDLGVEAEARYDVLIVGGGPAGVAAAVYAGAEGLTSLLIDEIAIGGQAGTSSRIENYLGFPTGISGADLLWRGQIQAMKFGATFAMPRRITAVSASEDGFFAAQIDDVKTIYARAVVVATGVQYRRLPLARLEHFEGNGIYYAATESEARHCAGRAVMVIGGGNSAGQAAMFLSRHASHVYVVVRGPSLAASMSDYLASRLRANPAITIEFGCQVTELAGDDTLEGVVMTERSTGEGRALAVCGLFVMAGAAPNSGWLEGLVDLDDKGFVITGPAAGQATPYETSTKGVFAVGDVRSGSVKRVASAAGEGSVVISRVWDYVQSVKDPV